MFESFLYIWDGKSEVYFRIVGEDDSCKPSIETKTSRVLLWSSIADHHRHSCVLFTSLQQVGLRA